MNTLHLFVTDECTNRCPKCCNRMYPAKDIPFVTKADIESAELVCLTGGEPFLFEETLWLARNFKAAYPGKKLVGYSSGEKLFDPLFDRTLDNPLTETLTDGTFDGFTVAPKNIDDVYMLNYYLLRGWAEPVTIDLVKNKVSFRFYKGLYIDKEPVPVGFWERVATWPATAEVIERPWRDDDWTTEGSVYRRLPVLFHSYGPDVTRRK